MDKIYIGNSIPDGYIYGEVTRDYVTLYNKPSFHNESATYYRIYYNYSSDLVVSGTTDFNSYYTTTFNELPVSRSFLDRPDAFKICSITFIITFLCVFLLNCLTSFVKRGGALGGLL